MAVYHEAGSVLSASEMNQTVQATTASSTDQAHCIQAGSVSFSVSAGAADDGSVTFGTAFASAPTVVLTMNAGSSAGGYNTVKVHLRSVSASSFNWRAVAVSGTPTVSGTIEWMAFGQVSA